MDPDFLGSTAARQAMFDRIDQWARSRSICQCGRDRVRSCSLISRPPPRRIDLTVPNALSVSANQVIE
jgi:hypothetical protein